MFPCSVSEYVATVCGDVPCRLSLRRGQYALDILLHGCRLDSKDLESIRHLNRIASSISPHSCTKRLLHRIGSGRLLCLQSLFGYELQLKRTPTGFFKDLDHLYRTKCFRSTQIECRVFC